MKICGKRVIRWMALAGMMCLFAGCMLTEGIDKKDRETEVVVFAAASLTECFTEIKETYEEMHEVDIILNFAGSQVLKNQIQSGADPGMFFSANMKYPKQLVEESITVNGTTLKEDDILVFAMNRLVMISSDEVFDSFNHVMEMTETVI